MNKRNLLEVDIFEVGSVVEDRGGGKHKEKKADMDYILNHKTMYGHREKKEIELMRVNSYVKGAGVRSH